MVQIFVVFSEYLNFMQNYFDFCAPPFENSITGMTVKKTDEYHQQRVVPQ